MSEVPPAPHAPPPGLTEEQLAFLRRAFDLARDGAAGELLGQVDAGLPVDLTDHKGDTLLILAAYHTHAPLVRGLLDRGADHGRVNDRGQTALTAAVFRQDATIVTALLDAGADPDLGARPVEEVAAFFGLDDMLALVRSRRSSGPTGRP